MSLALARLFKNPCKRVSSIAYFYGEPLRLQLSDHWLSTARRIPSPNCNQRPGEAEVSLLLIHNISLPPGEFGGDCIEQFFTNCLDCSAHAAFEDLDGVEVSSHLVIDREGQVSQFVPFNQRAWHAGVSVFEGRENCNDFSIGIELEGTDDSPYTDSQYHQLVAICQLLMKSYPAISPARIVGHCDVAPSRKTDPGAAFDWAFFRGQLGS